MLQLWKDRDVWKEKRQVSQQMAEKVVRNVMNVSIIIEQESLIRT